MEHGLGLFSAQSIGVQEGVPWVGKEFGVGVAKDTCGHTVFSVLRICGFVWRLTPLTDLAMVFGHFAVGQAFQG